MKPLKAEEKIEAGQPVVQSAAGGVKGWPRAGRSLSPYLRAVEMKPPAPVTQAHRDEIVRQLQSGALSFRGLCKALHDSIPINLEPGGHGEKLGRVDRGLTRRTLSSAVDRGEVIAVLVRRPGQSARHRERKAFYVYAPSPRRERP